MRPFIKLQENSKIVSSLQRHHDIRPVAWQHRCWLKLRAGSFKFRRKNQLKQPIFLLGDYGNDVTEFKHWITSLFPLRYTAQSQYMGWKTNFLRSISTCLKWHRSSITLFPIPFFPMQMKKTHVHKTRFLTQLRLSITQCAPITD